MKVQLFQSVQTLENNLTKFITEKKHSEAQELFEKYSQSLYQYHEIEEEIPWDMLSSLAFVIFSAIQTSLYQSMKAFEIKINP